ncbi:MAG: hypothetical protein ACRDZR_13620 [Acidimicrobiales bacterium]
MSTGTGTGPDEQRIGQLRGAGVGTVDARRLGRAVVAVAMVALAVLVVVLYVAAARKNAQISSLRQNGVPVVVTVTGCQGELGGSGTNAAGYTCRGRYELDGRTYVETIPGDTRHDPGTRIGAVAVPGDPSLVSPAATVAGEHPSATPYVLPSVLLAILLLAGAGAFWVTRRARGGGPSDRRRTEGRPAQTARPAPNPQSPLARP